MTNITLTPITSYEVKVNGKSLGNFTSVSEWEGYRKLVDGNGNMLIVGNLSPAHNTSRLPGFAPPDSVLTAKVHKCSPELITALKDDVR